MVKEVTNKEKFKNMKGKEKITYIWEYYRWHIIGTLVGAFIVWTLGSAILRPRPPVYPVDVAVAGLLGIEQEAENSLVDTFNTELNAGLHIMPTDWSRPSQSSIATDQKMMLMIQVRELDLFVMSEQKYSTYTQIEDFDALTALDQFKELAPILDKYKDSLLTAKSKETGEEHVYGIKVKELSKLKGMEFGEPFVISLINPSKDTNAGIKIIQYLLGE